MRKSRRVPVSNDPTLPLSRSERRRGWPAVEPTSDVPVESRVQNALSVVMMAGIAFLPIVIAAGFLAEHFEVPSVPMEISTAALRGPIDTERRVLADDRPNNRAAEHPSLRVRAGF